MSDVQINPQVVIQNLVNEITRLNLELAVSRAAVEALTATKDSKDSE